MIPKQINKKRTEYHFFGRMQPAGPKAFSTVRIDCGK